MNQRAHAFDIVACPDPICCLHVIAVNEDYEPICEVAMSMEQVRWLADLCHKILYSRAVEADGQ
jgi:hypothetical protein